MITLQNVGKSFGGVAVVDDLTLSIEDGAFFVLIGPSGSGKSTALRMINAMIHCDHGRIELRGQDIREIDPIQLRRGIGYVIQSVGLFPHWTVEENIGAVPRLLGWSRAKISARVEEIAALLQIDEKLLRRHPRQLSGGQQQRVGIARALAANPEIILMDEPFAALDPVSRAGLQDELRRLHKRDRKTVVFVTHDMDEALRLATKMAVMNEGRLVQTGSPADIVLHPSSTFVSSFLGGGELQFRILDVVRVRDRYRRKVTCAAMSIPAAAPLKAALKLMVTHHCLALAVEDEKGLKVGEISVHDIVAPQHAI